MPDISVAKAAKLAKLIQQEAETERGEIADEEARRLVPDKLDLNDVHVNMIVTGVDKHPAASWTIRFAIAIEVLTELAALTWVNDSAVAVCWIGRTIAVLTILLRAKTRKPLRWKVKP